jgi:hypothetical protein
VRFQHFVRNYWGLTTWIIFVHKPGPRPTALAFSKSRPGQKPSQAKDQARLGPAFIGSAWPGFWLQAGAGTSLVIIEGIYLPESRPCFGAQETTKK